MIAKDTVLVLGAGASHDYGFPLGTQLRQDILALAQGSPGVSKPFPPANTEKFLEFIEHFSDAHVFSIDAFLGVNPQYADMGKQAIAYVIHRYEVESGQSMRDPGSNGWYSYLWNRLASGHSWEELSFKNLSIVTFNYDRSLEAFLLTAMRGLYGKDRDHEKKLRELKIVHVYGYLGSIWDTDSGYQPYGRTLEQIHQISQMSNQLQVIPEARDDAPSFAAAKKMLLQAEAICFLGFGFDALNLRRLDSENTCKPFMTQGYSVSRRVVAASCYGRTYAEARADAVACGFVYVQLGSAGLPENFVDDKCQETLRETLVLGRG